MRRPTLANFFGVVRLCSSRVQDSFFEMFAVRQAQLLEKVEFSKRTPTPYFTSSCSSIDIHPGHKAVEAPQTNNTDQSCVHSKRSIPRTLRFHRPAKHNRKLRRPGTIKATRPVGHTITLSREYTYPSAKREAIPCRACQSGRTQGANEVVSDLIIHKAAMSSVSTHSLGSERPLLDERDPLLPFLT